MKRIALLALAAAALAAPAPASAHFSPPAPKPWHAMTSRQKGQWLLKLKAHARWGARHAATRASRRDHRRQLGQVRGWLRKLHARQVRPEPHWSFWRVAQIWLAEKIADGSSGDPWPSCPDPRAGGGSWDDTARCEARGTFESIGDAAWGVDPPGFYRCALQFAPSWEPKYAGELRRRFGVAKVCP